VQEVNNNLRYKCFFAVEYGLVEHAEFRACCMKLVLTLRALILREQYQTTNRKFVTAAFFQPLNHHAIFGDIEHGKKGKRNC